VSVPLVTGILLVALVVPVPLAGAAATRPSVAPDLGRATHVADSVLEQVGVGGAAPPTILTGQPALLSRGKPEVVYVGAGYCPYCAVARWSLQIALAKFGTFSQLGPAASSSSMDVYPGVKSWGFQGSHYSSPYFSFAALDAGSSYPSVLPQPERRLLSTYDKPPYVPGQDRGAIPFIDIADRYVQTGSTASVAVLEHLTLNQISLDAKRPSSPVARSLDAAANYLIGALCSIAGQQSAPICASPMIVRVEAKLSPAPATTTTTVTPSTTTTTTVATSTTTGS